MCGAHGASMDVGSPFANCGALAGSIAQGGVAVDGDQEFARVPAAGCRPVPDFAAAASAMADAAAGLAAAAPPTMPSAPGLRITPPPAGGWPDAPSPVILGPGPVGGAQVGAGDVPPVAVMPRHTPPPGIAPEDLRLVMGGMRSPCGASSGNLSDAAVDTAVVEAWAADAGTLGEAGSARIKQEGEMQIRAES